MERHWGFTVAEQRALGGEVDQNVWIRTGVGEQFLVKVSVAGDDGSLSWQEALSDHLARTTPELPVPRLVPARSGERMLAVGSGDGDVRVMRLLTWLEGRRLADIEQAPRELLYDLGAVAARLTQALSGFPPQRMSHSHHWDLRRSSQAVEDNLPFIADSRDRECVRELMSRFDAAQPALQTLPHAIVHQDLNDFNVLAVEDGLSRWRISGVLDFGDALYTIRVAEVAVAAAYAMVRQPSPVDAVAAVVAGFDAIEPLSPQEVSVVFPLAAARLCVNATTWTRRTTEWHQPYGQERMRFTWPMIRVLAQIDQEEALNRIEAACTVAPTPPGAHVE